MDIEQEILQIKQRNIRVEQDKAWETSWARTLLITVLTYIVASIWLILIHDTSPFLKALVPVAGYLLSTFSIPWVKNIWIKHSKN